MQIYKSSVLLISIVGLGWWVVIEHDKRIALERENTQLVKERDQQAGIIAGQSLDFNRFNQIAASAQRNSTQAEAKSQEKAIEYRTILKKEPACDQLVPQPIADGLFEYTHSLRAGEMHSDTSNIN
ncbi:hypothetical protein V5049_12095 [Moellerella wisconsensis]|uniref:hypothetical protein n=1 Tax=Moellerella wisconsensis TaxID=158849 RepID=UPI0030761999